MVGKSNIAVTLPAGITQPAAVVLFFIENRKEAVCPFVTEDTGVALLL
jgi:hypothetical protein